MTMAMFATFALSLMKKCEPDERQKTRQKDGADNNYNIYPGGQ
jgi:hypothetical protein